ncbi:MAG TPA: hypothetical protein VK539_39885 [Myxococcaceae bacterium]|nr:hypothetical protein [Myxococcaceae bacterium]
MKRTLSAVLAALAAVLASCQSGSGSDGRRVYDNNDLELVTTYTAKDACTCLFVLQRDEAYCRAFVKASPQVARLTIYREQKMVETTALLLWGARARLVDERTGCQVDE